MSVVASQLALAALYLYLGTLRSSSVYRHESGGVGRVQQTDLTV